ncbi:MBL fold metallo-hydrolase [Candidatus Zixiibacteriota bacterium]
MSSESSQMDLGGLSLTIVDGGSFRLDGAALYGIYPRVFWEKLNHPDEDNRVLLGLAPVVVNTAEGVVLIDPGIGHNWNTHNLDRYDITGVRPLDELLKDADVSPADVIAVIATHLHFDHIAGAVTARTGSQDDQGMLSDLSSAGSENLVPALPEARLYLQKAELEASRQPDLRTATYTASLAAHAYEREDRLLLLDGDSEPFPGIRIEHTGGHTAGHQAVWLEGSEASVLITGDLIPTTSHVRSEVVEGVDFEPAATARVKAALLARAAATGTYLTFYHAPRVRWGRIRTGPSGGYQLDETHTVRSGTPSRATEA